MASQVEDLLAEQETTSLHLELLQGSAEHNDDILLEAMVTNENLDSLNVAIEGLSKNISASMRFLGEKMLMSADSQTEALAPIVNLAPTPAPLLLGPGPTEAAAIAETASDIIDVTPAASESVAENEDEQSDSLDELEESSASQVGFLATISKGITTLVSGTAKKASDFLGIDRQKDDDKDKGGGMDFGGKLAKAGLIGAAAVATGMLVKSVFEGLTDEKLIKDITGKAKEDLTASEQSFAALSHVVETLSFGLFSAKETFEATKPVHDILEKGMNALFDPQTGIFADFTTGVVQLLDGNIMKGLESLGKQILLFPLSMVDMGLRIGSTIRDLLPTSFVETVDEMMNPIFEPIFEFALNTVPDAFNAMVDSIVDGFNFVLDIPVKIADAMNDFASNISDKLLEKVKGLSEKIPFGLGDKLMGLFGDGEQEDAKTKSVAPKAGASDGATTIANEVVRDNVLPFAKPKGEGLSRPIVQTPSGENVPRLTGPSDVNASKTTDLSKERMEETKITVQAPAPQTIVVPQEKREERKVHRKKESNDMTLAFMSAGSM